MLERFELNYAGVRENLLKSEFSKRAVMEHANAIALRAGQDYEVVTEGTRVYVHPSNEQGEKDNLENNTLLKAVGR